MWGPAVGTLLVTPVPHEPALAASFTRRLLRRQALRAPFLGLRVVPAPIFVASADQLDAPTAAAAESEILFFFFVPDEAPSE